MLDETIKQSLSANNDLDETEAIDGQMRPSSRDTTLAAIVTLEEQKRCNEIFNKKTQN